MIFIFEENGKKFNERRNFSRHAEKKGRFLSMSALEWGNDAHLAAFSHHRHVLGTCNPTGGLRRGIGREERSRFPGNSGAGAIRRARRRGR